MIQQKTIKYRELVTDGNFRDKKFEEYVREWMRRNMRGFPMGLIDTEDPERWEVQPSMHHTVVPMNVTLWECPECECVHSDQEEECCYGEEDEPIPLRAQLTQGYAVLNENTGDYINDRTDYAWRDVEPVQDQTTEIDKETVYLWDDEGEANAAATWCDSAYESYADESRYGFPWANSYAYMPKTFIDDGHLKQAGFIVGTYTGGAGGQYDQEFRLCGIDGGGYNFTTQHFAKLVAIVTSEREHTVQTDQGEVVIDMDERSDLERLAAAEDAA